MKSGCKPLKKSHKDYSLFKTKRVYMGVVPAFAENYSVSSPLWIPDQETGSTLFTPPFLPMPYGCTDVANNQLCINEDGVLYNPSYTESFTHANANGGGDVRTALQTIIDHGVQDKDGNIVTGKHPAYFNIQASGAIDWFDAIRLAMISTSTEKRGVSVGSPYWLQFGAVGPNGILPSPDYDLHFASWHDYVIEGWKTINGECYLVCQMLQGENYGDHGLVYMSRPIFNATMAVQGTCAFTISRLLPGEQIQTVDMNIINWIVSYVRSLFHIV